VKAVSINPTDGKRRTNWAGNGPVLTEPKIVGFDGSGVIEQLGSSVSTKFKKGDEIYFAGNAGRPGSYAQYLAIDERIIAKKPKTFSFEHAAAEPLTILTAWEALFEGMAIPERTAPEQVPKTLLVTAGAGGAGSIAIQIAKKLLHLRVIATASRPESIDYCKKMGADHVIDHTKDLRVQLEGIGLKGVDYIYNCADFEPIINKLIDVVSPFGKICTITASINPVPINISGIHFKRAHLIGELMFTRSSLDIEQEKQGAILERAADLLDSGVLTSRCTTIYEDIYAHIADAHRQLDSGRTIGKISLKVPQ